MSDTEVEKGASGFLDVYASLIESLVGLCQRMRYCPG